MMIYLQLFSAFLQVGTFAFGAAYGAIPLIRELVIRYGWFTEETFANWIAISESIPGPIITELASFVGYDQAGVLGAVVATAAVILPSVVIVILSLIAFEKFVKNRYFNAFLSGVRPCVTGMIMATGLHMIIKYTGALSGVSHTDTGALTVTCILGAITILYRLIAKKTIDAYLTIIIGGILGAIVYSVL